MRGWGCAAWLQIQNSNLELGLISSLLEAKLKMESHHLLFVETENPTIKERLGRETAWSH